MALLGPDERFDTKLIAIRELGVDCLWDGHVRGMVYNTVSMAWEAQTNASSGGSSSGLTDTQLRATPVPVSGSVSVSNFPATQPISASSLPLPTNAATSANQTTANTSLASIDSKTPALGQALAAGSVPTVLPAAQIAALTPPTTVAVSNFPASQTVAGSVSVSNFPASQAVTGAFFQATQPVSAASLPLPSGASQEHTTAASPNSVRLTDGATFYKSTTPADTQPVSAASLPLPAGASTETTLAALNAKVAAVNTGAVTISSSVLPTGAALDASLTTVNISVNTLLKPASTLAGVTTVGAVTTITNALPTGTNSIGTVQAPGIAKSTQGVIGWTTQDLKDAGRNAVHYYTLIPVLTTVTDTLQLLTGTKAGATVAATTTPAVVTSGKNMRITRMAATYIATATSGYGIVRLRFNTAGVVAITSPIAATLAVGAGTPGTANSVGTVEAPLEEGVEFAAATGIGVSVQGFAAVTATAVGYVMVSVTGYEY